MSTFMKERGKKSCLQKTDIYYFYETHPEILNTEKTYSSTG